MEIIKNPLLLIVKCKSTPLFRWIPDKKYIELYYRAALGKKLNLDNPKTFNEKLQWLKLYDRKEEYSPDITSVAIAAASAWSEYTGTGISI